MSFPPPGTINISGKGSTKKERGSVNPTKRISEEDPSEPVSRKAQKLRKTLRQVSEKEGSGRKKKES